MPVRNENLSSLGFKEPDCEAALKQYEIESKNSYSLRLSMIEEKYSCLANNKLYSPKTQTRKEYEKSEHIKEKLLDYIRLNISSSSKQDYGDQWQDIEEGIKKNQVGNSKKGKSKGVAKYSKLLQNENYNDDHYENDSISVDDIDKWGSSHGSFISKNLSCETRAEGNIRNNVSKTSVVSHCPSETINKMKRKRSRPPKFDKESHCSSKSINKIKRKHCSPPKFDEVGHCSSKSTNKIKRKRSRPPKFDDVSHRGVKKFKAQLGNSVEVFDSGLGSCDDTRNFHEINKDTQNVIDPKQAKSFNDDDTKIKDNISKKKLKILVDKNGKHIKESTTENIKKNKRKRACPKSDVISQEGVNMAKPQLGNSDEIFYIESVSDFNNTKGNIKRSKNAIKQTKKPTKIPKRKNYCQKVSKKNHLMTDKNESSSFIQTIPDLNPDLKYSKYFGLDDLSLTIQSSRSLQNKKMLSIFPLYSNNKTTTKSNEETQDLSITLAQKQADGIQEEGSLNDCISGNPKNLSDDRNFENNFSKIGSEHNKAKQRQLIVKITPIKQNNAKIALENEERSSDSSSETLRLGQKVSSNECSSPKKSSALKRKISTNEYSSKKTSVARKQNLQREEISEDQKLENEFFKSLDLISVPALERKISRNEYSNKKTSVARKQNLQREEISEDQKLENEFFKSLDLISVPALERKISRNEYSNKKTSVARKQNLQREEVSEDQKFENKFSKLLHLVIFPEIEKQKRQGETRNKTINLKQMHQNNLTKSRAKESKKPSQHQNLRDKDAQPKNSQADLNNSADNLEMTERENSFLTLDNKQEGNNTWSPKHNFECNESQTTPNTKPKNLKIKLNEPNISQEKVDSETELPEKSNKILMNALSASYMKNSFILKTPLTTIEEEESFSQIGSSEKAGNVNNYQRKLGQEIPTYNLNSNFGSNIKKSVEKTIQTTDNLRNETEINGNLNNREEITVSSHANVTQRKNRSLELRLRPLRVEMLRNGTEINSIIDNKEVVMPEKKANLKPQLKSSEDMRNRIEINGDLDKIFKINVSSHICPKERKIRSLKLRLKSSEENLKNGTEINRNLNSQEQTTVSSHTSPEDRKTRRLEPRLKSSEENLKNRTEINRTLNNREETTVSSHSCPGERKTHGVELRLKSSEENLKNGTEINRNLSNKEETTLSSDTSPEERKSRSLKLQLNSSEENLKNRTERNRNLNNSEETTVSSNTSPEERRSHSLKLQLKSSEENLKNRTEINRNLSNKKETTISSHTSPEERKTRTLKLRLNSNGPVINSTLLPMKREEYEMSIRASKSSLMKSTSTLKENSSSESRNPLWHGSSKNENNKTVSALSYERSPPISDDSQEKLLPIDFSSYTFLSVEDTKIGKARENILLGCSYSKFDRAMKSLLLVE